MSSPANPSFWAYQSGTASNVSGNGDAHTVICDTEAYDTYNEYDHTSGIFTAGFSRMYQVSGVITVSDIGILHSGIYFNLVMSGGTKRVFALVPSSAVLSGIYTSSFSREIFFNANDTAYMQVVVEGSSKTVDIPGGTDPYLVEFGATLVS